MKLLIILDFKDFSQLALATPSLCECTAFSELLAENKSFLSSVAAGSWCMNRVGNIIFTILGFENQNF